MYRLSADVSEAMVFSSEGLAISAAKSCGIFNDSFKFAVNCVKSIHENSHEWRIVGAYTNVNSTAMWLAPGYNYDHLCTSLQTSPLLIERYLDNIAIEAARKAAEHAQISPARLLKAREENEKNGSSEDFVALAVVNAVQATYQDALKEAFEKVKFFGKKQNTDFFMKSHRVYFSNY